MAYTINFSSGSKPSVIINDNTFNTTSLPITLIGKSVLNWGEIIQENYIKILENFDSSTEPAFPTSGMLWSDNTNPSVSRMLKIRGDVSWKQVAIVNTGSLPVTGQYLGQLWYNTGFQYFWNGTVWKKLDTDCLLLTGGTVTGAIVNNITPTLGTHLVNKTYVDDSITNRSVLLATGGNVLANISVSVAPTLGNHLTNKTYVDSSLSSQLSTITTNYLQKSGGTLTGYLTLHANPTNNLHPATKQYVDSALASIGTGLGYTPVNKAGDTLTGFLTVHADPTNILHVASKQYVDNNPLFLKLTGGTITGAVTFNNNLAVTSTASFTNPSVGVSFTKLPTSIDTPTAANQLVTKNYVDTTAITINSTITGTIAYNNSVVINNDYHLTTRIYNDGRYLRLSGGTLTGNLTLDTAIQIVNPNAPTTGNHLVNKTYVDNAFLAKSGGTVTGTISASTAPTIDSHLTNKLYVDNKVATSGSTFAGGNITNHTFITATYIDPLSSTQVVTYGYLLDNFVHRDPNVNGTSFREIMSYDSLFHTSLSWASLSNINLVTKGLVESYSNIFVQKSGSTLTGYLTLHANPTNNLHPATKQYVDTAVSTAPFLSTTGGTLIGKLVYDNSLVISNNYDLITKLYADNTYVPLSGGPLTNNFTFNGNTIFGNIPNYSGVAVPTLAGDLITKSFFDDINNNIVKDSMSSFYHTDFMNGIIGTVFETNNNNTGVVVKYQSTISTANGLVDLRTETHASGGAEINDGFVGGYLASENLYLLIRTYIPTLSTLSEEYKLGFGFVEGGSYKDAASTSQFMFVYDRTVSTNWLVILDGTTFTTSVAVTASQLTVFKVIYNYTNNTIDFFINGTNVHQFTSVGITSNVYGFQAFIKKSNGTTSRSLLIDKVLYGKLTSTISNWVI